MALRSCLLVVAIGVVGCGPNLKAASSGQIGCPEDDIEIHDDDSGWGAHTWTATCHGRVFYCSYHVTGKHSGQYSCTQAMDGGEGYRREHESDKTISPPPERHQGPVVVSRKLEFYGGGTVGVRGMPTEAGGRLELEAELVRDPVTIASWSECTNGLLVADDAAYPLHDMSVRASGDSKPTTLRATASVGALTRVVKAKQKAGIVACGQKTWLDGAARRTLFALLQEFKVIADRSGTWDPSLKQDADPAPAPDATSPPQKSAGDPVVQDSERQADDASAL
jgi:hypothetical protein